MHPDRDDLSVKWRNGLLVWLLLSTAMLSGCVERRMLIRSNPPGALVYVGKKEVGLTPVGVNFTYYGPREITLVKDGYETLTDVVEVRAPWYQYFPADFVTENLIPARIRDYRSFDYQLQPKYVVPTEQILQRAEQLRQTGGPLNLPAPPPFSPPVTPAPLPPGPAVETLPPLGPLPPNTPLR